MNVISLEGRVLWRRYRRPVAPHIRLIKPYKCEKVTRWDRELKNNDGVTCSTDAAGVNMHPLVLFCITRMPPQVFGVVFFFSWVN